MAAPPASEPATPPVPSSETALRSPAETPRNAIAEWTITILLLLFGTTTLVQAFVIPTGSMEDTLLIGDHLLVDKLAYAPAGAVSKYFLPYTPVKRGDIIVFRYPVDVRQTFVKRVIGVPGDHIRILNKQVFLNGKPLREPYKYHKDFALDSYRDNFPSQPNMRLDERALAMLEHTVVKGEIVVPDDSFFAMGDNRDRSLDSRYWGYVPRANIVGKPLLVYWSFDATTEHLTSAGVDFPHLWEIIRYFPTKTRWSRTFMLVRGYPAGN